jgi:glucose-1-phosphate cytidylyltransferase
MKVLILAGEIGSRLSEETELKPKPMVEIGEWPILLHIMHIYSFYGFKEFIIALGYKGNYIKRYFFEYYYLRNSFSVNLKNGDLTKHEGKSEDWVVHLVDTGFSTQTGGRINRVKEWIGNETFLMTYGDGVSDINIQATLDFHRKHGKYATVSAVRPPARFGNIEFDANDKLRFSEKPQTGEGWINGGFFILEPQVFNYINNDNAVFEREPLEKLASDGQLVAYKHMGFWQCMDTMRDKRFLEELWSQGKAPWSQQK